MATQLLDRMTIEIKQDEYNERKLFVKDDLCECAGEDGYEEVCPFKSVCGVLSSLTIAEDQEVRTW